MCKNTLENIFDVDQLIDQLFAVVQLKIVHLILKVNISFRK